MSNDEDVGFAWISAAVSILIAWAIVVAITGEQPGPAICTGPIIVGVWRLWRA